MPVRSLRVQCLGLRGHWDLASESVRDVTSTQYVTYHTMEVVHTCGPKIYI